MDRLVIPVLSTAAAEVIADLSARHGIEVVAAAIDVGSGVGLDAVRDMALSSGARRCHVLDRRDLLAEGVLWPALRAGALGVYGEPVMTALSMPVVAEAVAEICRHEQATAVAVWADQLADRQRLRALLRDLTPSLGLVSVSADVHGGGAANLWARVELASDEAADPPATTGGAAVRIGFERGFPVALSGVPMTPAELIDSLATIVGAHGAGRFVVPGTPPGPRLWRVEAPAALALARAMDALTARVLDARTAEVASTLAEAYAGVIRDGAWFSPVRAGLEAFMDRVLGSATGDVAVGIVDGRIEVAA